MKVKEFIKEHPFKFAWAMLWYVPAMMFLFGFATCVAIVNLDVSEFKEVFRSNA